VEGELMMATTAPSDDHRASTQQRPQVRIGLAIPPKPAFGTLRQALGLARLLRLDSFMIWDHLEDLFPKALWNEETTWTSKGSASPHQFFDFQTALGALAPRAGRVRLGVAVTDPIRRHPVVIAQAALTLSHLTRRTPILGIGAGEQTNLQPYGLNVDRPVSRLEEALQVIRLCLDHGGQQPLSFSGTYYRLDRAHFDLQAPPGRTPRLWLGAHGPRMLRLTGQYGDGWYPTGALSPEQYEAKLETIHAAARAASRDPGRIMPAFQVTIAAAPTAQEARAMLEHPMIRYLGLLLPASTWAEHGHTHPFGDEFNGYVDILPESYSEAELRAALAAVPVMDLADTGVIWGTPEQILRRLHDYVDAGMRYIVPNLPALMVSRRAALYNVKLLHMIRREFRSHP
jgi:phthiodiolone/phenolphthiodiolone dimycocerosates ketoreductase